MLKSIIVLFDSFSKSAHSIYCTVLATYELSNCQKSKKSKVQCNFRNALHIVRKRLYALKSHDLCYYVQKDWVAAASPCNVH